MRGQEKIESAVLKDDQREETTHILNRSKERRNKKKNKDQKKEKGGRENYDNVSNGDDRESSSKGNQEGQIKTWFHSPPNSKGPWLVSFGYAEHGQTLTIYSMDENKTYISSIHQLRNMVMSSHGWILREHWTTKELTLENPVSMEVIDIPSPPYPPLTCEAERYFTLWVYSLTAAPTDEDCILLATELSKPYMNFYILKEKKWFQRRYMKDKDAEFPHVVVCNGSIYVLRRNSCSVKLDFNNYELTTKYLNVGLQDDLFLGMHGYMVESSGELFFVKSIEVVKSNLVKGFNVYKMNFLKMEWVPVRTIGHRAFCLDFSKNRIGFSCNAHDAGLQGDCIYYVNRNHLYQYNLLDRSIMVLTSFKILGQLLLCPSWVLFRPQVGNQCKNVSTNANSCKKNLENKEDFQRHNGMMAYHDTRKTPVVGSVSQEEELWSMLLPELVSQILHLLSYIDSRCLIHAIPSWLPSIRTVHTWQFNSPCLLSFTSNHKTCRLFDPLRNMCHVIDSSVLPNEVKILHCKYGWLLLMASKGHLIFFYNPLTKSRIVLPRFTFHCTHNFSFSSPPTSPNCVVVAHYISRSYRTRTVIVCRKGHQDWIVHNEEQFTNEELDYVDTYTTPVFLSDKLYWSGEDGRIRVFDLATGSWEVHGFKLEMPHHLRHYLLESDGEIFFVRGTLNGNSICMYKLNRSSYKWDETYSSGGRCFFLSPRTSISVSASGFKDNEEKLYFPMLHDRCFVHYSCKTQKVHPTGNFEGVKELLLGSCWIEPHCAGPTVEELLWAV